MERTLDVYLHRDLVGVYGQDASGKIYFRYLESWLEKSTAVSLSHSLPLRKERFNRRECSGFFGGILPEQLQRHLVAGNLGISEHNDFAMLERIGGECAGAVTLLPMGENLPEESHTYQSLAPADFVKLLRTLPLRPLMAGEEGVRLSLAGAQTKMALHVSKDGIAIPRGGALSTHIIKPAIAHFPGIVFNEALCMSLATEIGLQAAKVEIGQAEEITYLQVKRYDRKESLGADGLVSSQRIHQEDFCQALGITSEHKYQSEGGPTLRQSFDLVREVCSLPALGLNSLLNGVIFNYLIGNYDAHGKNFSFLYGKAPLRLTRLAPFYDLICTGVYPNLSQRMAMKIGGEADPSFIFPRHFEKFAEDVKLSIPLVRRLVPELAEKVHSRLPEVATRYPQAESVANFINDRCGQVIRRFAG